MQYTGADYFSFGPPPVHAGEQEIGLHVYKLGHPELLPFIPLYF